MDGYQADHGRRRQGVGEIRSAVDESSALLVLIVLAYNLYKTSSCALTPCDRSFPTVRPLQHFASNYATVNLLVTLLLFECDPIGLTVSFYPLIGDLKDTLFASAAFYSFPSVVGRVEDSGGVRHGCFLHTPDTERISFQTRKV